ncbi:MAG: site-specific integrase [Candidatus Nitrosotenuis sp.]|nr:site-specific integrase [Candidatus Nitrosotenuis sp.]
MKITKDNLVKIEDNPLELFYQGIKSQASRKSYAGKLRQVLCEYLEEVLEGSFEKRSAQIVYKAKAKIKNIPSDQEISQFVEFLDTPFNLIFLMLHNSGLRIGEMMSIKVRDVDFATNMINVSNIHEGDTKSAWISFFTKQTASYLKQYIQYHSLSDDSRLFAMSERSVQNVFKEVSETLGITINPHPFEDGLC